MAYSNYYAASGLFHGSMSSVMGTQFDILMVGSDPAFLVRSGKNGRIGSAAIR